MRWRGGRASSNVEDRRGIGGGGLAVGGGLGTLVLVLLAAFCGVDPRQFLDQAPADGGGAGAPVERRTGNAEEDEQAQFVRVVLANTEDTWNAIFRQQGGQYREPTLVLFTGQVQSACGRAGASVGPFYCPADEKVYIDLSFYRELKSRFRAPGDFAQAYVIAHEVGHHIQNLLGAMERVHAAQQRAGQGQANQLSVRLELQADCYAGVWANGAERQGVVEPGDVEEALTAASAIGDDRLQRESQGYVVPDSFTHGSSAQRVRWFRVGLESGDLRRCDTFNTRSL
ncbi:MAG TPA: neutral zinc metallopeptidase [Pyrinomonadaceae bacterium]|nr:neutral zinc metallopeptidase [Pyrinomonadaceae bacterium]